MDYEKVAGQISEGQMVVLAKVGDHLEQLMVPGPVPEGWHTFGCRKLIEDLNSFVKKYSRDAIVLITYGDDFEFCLEGRCINIAWCQRLPRGIRVISLHPFVELVA